MSDGAVQQLLYGGHVHSGGRNSIQYKENTPSNIQDQHYEAQESTRSSERLKNAGHPLILVAVHSYVYEEYLLSFVDCPNVFHSVFIGKPTITA